MTQALQKFTATDYLAWESLQEQRHEFIHGETYAMAGGTAEHNLACIGLVAALSIHLRGSPCQVFMSDMRLRVAASEAYFYPDVVVTCSERDTQNPKITHLESAKLIAEILSPSTAGFDRGAKFAHYRLLPDLLEYMLIDPEERTVEVFRKNDSGIWELHPSNAQSPSIRLVSVGWQGDLQQLVGASIAPSAQPN